MTPKQQRFVEEYLIDLNATQAAIRAGYSSKSARQIGDEYLSKPDISAAVAEAMKQRSQDTAIDASWVLTEARKVYEVAMGKDSLPAALKALEIMGKHVNVQAFKDQIDHRHSMSFEEAKRHLAYYVDRYRKRSAA